MATAPEAGQLKDFLIFAAQHGYANETVEKTREANGSDSIRIVHDDWLAHDNYFTSEDGHRFHGAMVTFLADKAMWYCGYSGFVAEHANPKEVYGFLKKAMLLPEADFPIRGPWHLAEGEWDYEFTKTDPTSTLEKFETVEVINRNGMQVYEGVFYGGKIA
jgi:hypothetical protein